MPRLFDPLTLKDITLRNRIGVSPMCQYTAKEGFLTDWHLVHLGARALGGAALVITEATAVEARGRISPGDVGLWSDAQVEAHARLTAFERKHGAVPGIQIAHAGRKASAARPWDGGAHLADDAGGWPVIGPSAVAFGASLAKVPAEMSLDDVRTVQAAFAATARRALDAGYEWLELHGAHGYLMHSFLSPLSNRRSDGYGGSFENRIRFVVETTRAVRTVWPERLPLTLRLSATDWVDGGWTLDESVALARILKLESVDLIDCSSGGNTTGLSRDVLRPGYQVPFAERIRREAQIATAAVGLISEPMHADSIIAEGRADIVLLAREFLRDPHWPRRAAAALGIDAASVLPKQYSRA